MESVLPEAAIYTDSATYPEILAAVVIDFARLSKGRSFSAVFSDVAYGDWWGPFPTPPISTGSKFSRLSRLLFPYGFSQRGDVVSHMDNDNSKDALVNGFFG